MKNPIAIVGFILILLFCAASFYCYPQYDDFRFTASSLKQSFWAMQVSEYKGWDGRFTSTALLTVNPMVWGTLASYRALAAGLILALVFSLYTLLAALRRRQYFDLPPLEWAIILSAIYILSMPDVAQAFYWLTASLTYTVPIILGNFALAIYFSSWPRAIQFIAIAPLLFACVGGNETIMVMIDYGFAITLAWGFFRTRKIDHFLVGLFVVAMSASLLVIAAPGNGVRSAYFEHRHQTVRTLGNLVQFTLTYSFKFLTLPALALIVTFFSSGWRNFVSSRWIAFLQANRWRVLGAWAGFTMIACLPASWAMGGQPNARTQNMIAYYVLLGAWPVLFAFFNEIRIRQWRLKLSPYGAAAALVICFNAVDLAKGYLGAFDRYAANWQNMIQGGPDRLLERQKPKTVFFDDLNNVSPEQFREFKSARPDFF